MRARLAIPLLLLAAACGGRYRVNEVADSLPNLYLHEVRVGSGETTLVFRFEAHEASAIGVHPPGHPDAFVLRSEDGTATFALTEVSGIAELPETTSVDARDSCRFSLTFEALPEGATRFACAGVLGGPAPERVGFARVDLRAESVVRR